MNIKPWGTAGAAALAALLVLSGCAGAADDDPTDPPITETQAPTDPTDPAAPVGPGTIVDVAAANEDFSTLVAAVQAAGLAETLSGAGPFTVFAPTDAAFAALPEGLVDALLEEANRDVLVSILTYHVVAGEVTSDQIAAGDVATVEGQSVTIGTDDGVTVNDATVVLADVPASNGVIHAIDAVLVPPDVDPASLLG